MGEAKRRGTYEERKAGARAKPIKMSAVQRKAMMAQLTNEMMQRMLAQQAAGQKAETDVVDIVADGAISAQPVIESVAEVVQEKELGNDEPQLV